MAARLAFPGELRRTVCGTPNYIAPEVLESTGHTYPADIWALGVIIYTLLIGSTPFQSIDQK
jgi:serine/threonine protein kinase